MENENAKVRAYKVDHLHDGICLCATVKDVTGKHKIATNFVYQEYETFTETTPFSILSPEQAQALMDDLWTCGVRPTEGKGTAGAMAATEKHLKDMRAIVSDRLKVIL